MDITADNIAKVVNGKVERGGSIVCCCPVHEATGTHTPSLVLTITDERRILFHCRSQNCDAKHFRTICNYLVEKCGLPRSRRKLRLDEDQVLHQEREEALRLQGLARGHGPMVRRQTAKRATALSPRRGGNGPYRVSDNAVT